MINKNVCTLLSLLCVIVLPGCGKETTKSSQDVPQHSTYTQHTTARKKTVHDLTDVQEFEEPVIVTEDIEIDIESEDTF